MLNSTIELEQNSLKKKTPDSYLKDCEKGVEKTEFFLITVEHIPLIFNISFVFDFSNPRAQCSRFLFLV